MTDFESAQLVAVASAFAGCYHFCCEFHFRQNVRKHVVDCGLSNDLDYDVNFQQFVRLIWSVCAVPITEIDWYYSNIVHPKAPYKDNNQENLVYNQKLTRFIQYIERTYFGALKQDGSRSQGRYPPRTWNKHEFIEGMRDSTNNKSESFNRFLMEILKSAPNLWVLLKGLKTEESRARAKVLDDAQGNIPHYIAEGVKRKKYIRKKKALKTIVAGYSRENIAEFTANIAKYYSDYHIE